MEKLEKILMWSLISATAVFSIGMILGTINQVLWLDITIDTFSVYLVMAAIVPFLLFQFLYAANFDLFGTGNKKILKVFLYLLVFPTIDIIFISGVNTIFQIIPSFAEITDPVEFESARVNAMQHFMLLWAATYIIIYLAAKIFYSARAWHFWKLYLDNIE